MAYEYGDEGKGEDEVVLDAYNNKEAYGGMVEGTQDTKGTYGKGAPYQDTGNPQGTATRTGLEYAGGVVGAIVGAIIGAKTGDVAGMAMKGFGSGKAVGRGIGQAAVKDEKGKTDLGTGAAEILGGGVVDVAGAIKSGKAKAEAARALKAAEEAKQRDVMNKEDALDSNILGDSPDEGTEADFKAEEASAIQSSIGDTGGENAYNYDVSMDDIGNGN